MFNLLILDWFVNLKQVRHALHELDSEDWLEATDNVVGVIFVLHVCCLIIIFEEPLLAHRLFVLDHAVYNLTCI